MGSFPGTYTDPGNPNSGWRWSLWLQDISFSLCWIIGDWLPLKLKCANTKASIFLCWENSRNLGKVCSKLVLILRARSLPRSRFCLVTQRSSPTWRQKRLSGRLASKLCVWKSRKSEVMRTRATGLAREKKDLGIGVSRRFWILSCCRLSSAQVLTSRRALTFENKLKRFSSTLPMFVSVFRNVLNDVYFF